MFTLKKDNPFASPEPFHDEVNLHDDAERGFASSSQPKEVPSALGVGSSAWGASGVVFVCHMTLDSWKRQEFLLSTIPHLEYHGILFMSLKSSIVYMSTVFLYTHPSDEYHSSRSVKCLF